MTSLTLAGRTWTVGALPARLRAQIDQLGPPTEAPDDETLWRVAFVVWQAIRIVDPIDRADFVSLPFSNAELLTAFAGLRNVGHG